MLSLIRSSDSNLTNLDTSFYEFSHYLLHISNLNSIVKNDNLYTFTTKPIEVRGTTIRDFFLTNRILKEHSFLGLG